MIYLIFSGASGRWFEWSHACPLVGDPMLFGVALAVLDPLRGAGRGAAQQVRASSMMMLRSARAHCTHPGRRASTARRG